MKLRYDFNTSQKTYRTFPQKVVQSTGLLDRWSFLRWCCPFCLEKPRSQSRKSSVPVIRITRPRSPDSDPDSEEEEEDGVGTRRRGSEGSTGSIGSGGSLGRSQRGCPNRAAAAGGDGDAVSIDSSLGSGELDIINEEMDEAKDYDSESIESKESIRSKTSQRSKTSSLAKEKAASSSSVKSGKNSWKSNRDNKSSTSDGPKDSRKSSKESLRSSRDSVKDKDSGAAGEKTRSPMKKLIKHLKRTASSPSPDRRSGDKRSASVRSTTSLEDGGGGGKGGKGGRGGGIGRSFTKKFSFTSSGGEWRTRSATVDNRSKTMGGGEKKAEEYKSATGEVIGQGVVLAKRDNAAKSATLDGKKITGMDSSVFDGNGNQDNNKQTYRFAGNWETKVDNALTGKSPPSANEMVRMEKGREKDGGRVYSSHPTNVNEMEITAKNAETSSTPHPEKVRMGDQEYDDEEEEEEEEEVTFKSPKKSLRKDSGRDTGSEMGVGEVDGRPADEREDDDDLRESREYQGGRGRRGKDARGGGRGRRNRHYVDVDEDGEELGGGETTESSPPETPAPKDRVYDSSSTKPSSGFEDESTGSLDEGVGQKSGSPSPLVGSMGRTSGRESVASLASSTDNSTVTHPDEDIERLMQISEKKRNSLTPLGSRSESMASVCSAGAEGRYGTVIIKGEIELGLQYNYKEGQLECHVVQCRELAAVDSKRNRSDPYVKVYLLPDKSKSGKRKTKVKKHTLNPIFEEVLRFSTTMSELDSRTLWVSVWHSDMFGRNDFLGEVIIALADTVFDDVTPKWYPLQDRTEPMEDLSYSPRGDLIMALKFVPPDAVSSRKAKRSRGALHVLVKEAKSLAAARPHGTADPICKGLLLPEKGKASKQKTSVCRKTLNPTWNHTLVFEDTSLQELTDRALELSVWDHDRLGTSPFLGGCRLSLGKGKHGGRPVEWMEAAGMEVKLWEQMLERPNLWVEGSIMLRPTMDKPIYSSSMTE